MALAFAGCATFPSESVDGHRYDGVATFSEAAPGGELPGGWQPWILSRFKRNTEYRLVKDEDGMTVVRADADQSASGIIRELDIDVNKTPQLTWRWRVPALIKSADNTDHNRDDSPVRVILTFDGDHSKLDVEERAIAGRVKALTGREMPYATIMYIWENHRPVNDIIESKHTSRVQMVVVESGISRSGRWLSFARNVADDYRRIYGEAPGRIRGIGLMTDTDNTGERTRAYYGDINFSAIPPPNPAR